MKRNKKKSHKINWGRRR